MIPINIANVIKVMISVLAPGFRELNIISVSNDPKLIAKPKIPISKNTSPNLFIINAFNAALLANILEYQKLIKKYETKPT